MQACSEIERRFVWAYLLNGGEGAQSAREVGYAENGAKQRAYEVLQRPRVREALKEVAKAEFDGLLLPAVLAVKNLIGKPDHPDHMKTALSVLSRLGLGERTALDVHHSGEVELNHTDQAVEDLRLALAMQVSEAKLLEMFGTSGLPRYRRMLAEVDARRGPKLIEGEVVK